jgi:hypothetical protein
MNKETLSSKINYAEIGELLNHEEAAKMVKDYNDANPDKQYCFSVGRNIIEKVLSQPGCVGLRLYNAINESGMQTIVYAGIDKNGRTILEFPVVSNDGKLGVVEGYIGDKDRVTPNWF